MRTAVLCYIYIYTLPITWKFPLKVIYILITREQLLYGINKVTSKTFNRIENNININ